MTTEATKTNDKRFRTVKDDERTKRAAEVVADKQAAFDAAQSVLEAAEADCAEDPSDANFTKAKRARAALEDADRDLALARKYASKVESEVAAAERVAVKNLIARLEASLTVVDDEAMRTLAAEIAVLCSELRTSTEAKAVQRREEIEAINALKARVGEKTEDVPSVEKIITAAFKPLAELGLSVQAQCGTHWRGPGGAHAPGLWMFPGWREMNLGGVDVQEFRTGTERIIDSGTWINPETQKLERRISGRDGTAIVDEAKRLLGRVKAKREALAKGGSVGATAKAAAVGLVVAALTMVQG